VRAAAAAFDDLFDQWDADGDAEHHVDGADYDYDHAADELRAEPDGAARAVAGGAWAGNAGDADGSVARGDDDGDGDAEVPKLRDAGEVVEAGGAGVRGAGAGGAGDDVDGVREQFAVGAAASADDAGGSVSVADNCDGAWDTAAHADVDGACVVRAGQGRGWRKSKDTDKFKFKGKGGRGGSDVGSARAVGARPAAAGAPTGREVRVGSGG